MLASVKPSCWGEQNVSIKKQQTRGKKGVVAAWEALGQVAEFQTRLGTAWVREEEHLGPIRLRDRAISSGCCNYLEGRGCLGSLCLLALGILRGFGRMLGSYAKRSDRTLAPSLQDCGHP